MKNLLVIVAGGGPIAGAQVGAELGSLLCMTQKRVVNFRRTIEPRILFGTYAQGSVGGRNSSSLLQAPGKKRPGRRLTRAEFLPYPLFRDGADILRLRVERPYIGHGSLILANPLPPWKGLRRTFFSAAGREFKYLTNDFPRRRRREFRVKKNRYTGFWGRAPGYFPYRTRIWITLGPLPAALSKSRTFKKAATPGSDYSPGVGRSYSYASTSIGSGSSVENCFPFWPPRTGRSINWQPPRPKDANLHGPNAFCLREKPR